MKEFQKNIKLIIDQKLIERDNYKLAEYIKNYLYYIKELNESHKNNHNINIADAEKKINYFQDK